MICEIMMLRMIYVKNVGLYLIPMSDALFYNRLYSRGTSRFSDNFCIVVDYIMLYNNDVMYLRVVKA
jgi:hypothetical protein